MDKFVKMHKNSNELWLIYSKMTKKVSKEGDKRVRR